VYYRFALLRQRVAWIRELRDQEATFGVRLGDVGHITTARDHCDVVAAVNPSALLDEEELLDSELNLLAESEALAEGTGEAGDAGWEDAGVFGEGEDDDDNEYEGGPAAFGLAHPRFRGKAWYPKLFALVPGAHAVRRSVRLCNGASNEIFRRPLNQVLFNLPALPRHAEFAASILTNGFSLSLPYRLRPAPPTKEAAAAALAAGHPPPRVHPEDAQGRRALAQHERVVSVDAGNTFIVVVFERVVDPFTGKERERVYKLSTREWRAQRKDEERLAMSRAWCATLAAPGGAFPRLQAVSRKV